MDWIADANVHFLNWVVVEDEKLCVQCKNMWGKVYERHNLVFPLPPLHPNCRCSLQPIQTAKAGTVTNEKHNGADRWIKSQGKLPDYYITYQEAVKLGFKPKEGNLDNVTVEIKGLETMPDDMRQYAQTMLKVFDDVHSNSPNVIFKIATA